MEEVFVLEAWNVTVVFSGRLVCCCVGEYEYCVRVT